jgi:hypothetical protein
MILLIIFVSAFLCVLGYAFLHLFWLGLELRFLRFKLEDHPALIELIESVLQRITTEQNLPVFYKTYEEINAKKEKGKEALGVYVYSRDVDHKKKNEKTLQKIRNLEKKYNRPYKDICKLFGEECNIEEDSFIYPKILLCHKEAEVYGLLAFYSTYFHEIGHHFAITLNNDESEEAADRIAREMVRDNLPYFFQLLPFIGYTHRLKEEPTVWEKIKGYWNYYRYYKRFKIKRNDTLKQQA